MNSTIDEISSGEEGDDSSTKYPALYYSRPERQALLWTPRFSALLSIFGSSVIIFMILRKRKEKLERIHNRLLLGMSTVDVFNSAALGLTNLPIPHGKRRLKDLVHYESCS